MGLRSLERFLVVFLLNHLLVFQQYSRCQRLKHPRDNICLESGNTEKSFHTLNGHPWLVMCSYCPSFKCCFTADPNWPEVSVLY